MKEFFGVGLVTCGITAMVYALVAALFLHTDAGVAGGLGLLAAVIGAAILGDK